jgi:hypothetical protein
MSQWAASTVVVYLVLMWEVFEIWIGPVVGHWCTSNVGNTAVDISSALWVFMYVYDAGWGWQTWWLAAAVPGLALGRWARSESPMVFHPGTFASTVRGDPQAKPPARTGAFGACAAVIQWVARLVPLRRKALDQLEPRMPIVGAHAVFAWVSAAFALCLLGFACTCVDAPGSADFVPVYASFTLGFALAQPTIVPRDTPQWRH